MEKRYTVGIDLGTTNSALAVSEAESAGAPEIVPVPQLVSLQASDEAEILPSALYLPPEAEAAAVSAHLPWVSDPQGGIIGSFAREHGGSCPTGL